MKEDERVNMVWRGMGVLLVTVQAIVSVMLIVSLMKMGVIANWIIVLIGIFLGIVLALNVVILLVLKKVNVIARIVCLVLGLVAIVGCLMVMRYADAFSGFLNRVTERRRETKAYSVVVKDESAVGELDELKGKNVGFLKTDKLAPKAEQYLNTQVKINARFYDDIDTLIGVLGSEFSDAIVLESERIQVMQDEVEGEIVQMREIYTFEIELDEESYELSSRSITTEPFIVYISGIDSRAGLQTASLSDVNIVVVVNPRQGKMLLASIPRDTYVQLHDTVGLKDKLTHAGMYGIGMSKATIEDFLGIQIDHTIKVSFATVVDVVNQLDGIEIYSDTNLHLTAFNGETCNYVVGKQVVDGDCALRFARERKSYATGDLHRGANQQEVITGIVKKLSGSKDYLLKLPEILEVVADSFETSLSRDEITGFIRMQLDSPKDWQVESIAVNGEGILSPTYSMGENQPLYVMIPDMESVQNMTKMINSYLIDNALETD